MKEKILIVVDMQHDFVDGPLGTPEARAIVPKIEDKIKNGGYDRVLYTFDTHYADYMDTQEGKKLPVPHCIKGTHGWSTVFDSFDIFPMFGDSIIEKNTFGYKRWPAILGHYDNAYDVKSIELCGVCTDICVVSNALILKADYPEVPISVDASCCAGTTPENHKAALMVMKSCQIDIINEE